MGVPTAKYTYAAYRSGTIHEWALHAKLHMYTKIPLYGAYIAMAKQLVFSFLIFSALVFNIQGKSTLYVLTHIYNFV